jgi:hypothetical protein
MEYEIETQKVEFLLESILQNTIQHAHFYVFVSGLKTMGHGNRDKNLESHFTKTTVVTQINCYKTAM